MEYLKNALVDVLPCMVFSFVDIHCTEDIKDGPWNTSYYMRRVGQAIDQSTITCIEEYLKEYEVIEMRQGKLKIEEDDVPANKYGSSCGSNAIFMCMMGIMGLCYKHAVPEDQWKGRETRFENVYFPICRVNRVRWQEALEPLKGMTAFFGWNSLTLQGKIVHKAGC